MFTMLLLFMNEGGGEGGGGWGLDTIVLEGGKFCGAS